jgi:preprotein translocase subunit SecE
LFNRIKEFFREVKVELKKVVFPSRDEVIGSTKVVVVLVLIMAVFLGLVDMLLSKLVSIAMK